MAIYTTQVRSICEMLAGFEENGTYNTNEIIELSRPQIFNFTYPTFTDVQKDQLERNILRHYYFEEIGLETYAQWKLKLEARLNEIMPKYVNMYKLISMNFDPLHDVDYTRTRSIDGRNTNASNTQNTTHKEDAGNLNTNTTNNGSDTTDNLQWDKFNDTPQGAVTGIETDTYLTNARKVTNHTTDVNTDTSVSTSTSNNTSNGTNNTSTTENGTNNENLIEHIVGKYGGKTYAQLMFEYYENDFYNIDLMIIKELQDLFMGLWR